MKADVAEGEASKQDPGSCVSSSAQFPHCWTCLFGRAQYYVTAKSYPQADLPAGQ